MDGLRTQFEPRARWVLGIVADALGRTARFVDHEPELVYSPRPPEDGAAVWVPAQPEAQRFFEGSDPFPTPRVHHAAGLALLFPAVAPERPIPGDLVAGAFYLLARWDELRVPDRDRFDRLPLASSAFANIEGLSLEKPLVEDYILALGAALGITPSTRWSVALTHDIDRIRRRTLRGVAGLTRRRSWSSLRTLAVRDPWDNIPELLEIAARRGAAPTVYFIGRNRHRLDGDPRRTYERRRRSMARAVLAGGGEVALHASFASSESGEELAAEWRALNDEVGPLAGVRFHYLRFRYHETVRNLERAGVRFDTSLGFSEAPGFACGIARPFAPWLVGEERPADLQLVPLAVMDRTLDSRLGLDADGAGEKAMSVLREVRRVGGRVSLLWHNTYLDDDRAPGYGPLWGELLDELLAEGAELGPVTVPPDPIGGRLDGSRAVHLTSVHDTEDVRILHKEARALQRAGAETTVVGLSRRDGRARRFLDGWRLANRARAMDADIYHVHDPELLPAACWLRLRGGRVVYDVHEYLGRTARTKPWIPSPARLPIALAAERGERWFAKHLDGVVAVNPDLAARFAYDDARAVAVDNSPWGDAFPDPLPLPPEPRVVYVGGIGLHRGIELMREAYPLVDTPGAVLRLVGRGDAGAIAGEVEILGPVPAEDVAEHLAWARVAWIPLQASHGNSSRPVVPTKLIEAMAAGRPVVASDVGLVGQIVRDADCGIVVEPGSAAAHADALRFLLESPEAARLGRNGRDAFLDRFGFERQADRLVGLYRAVLDERPPRQ